MGALRSVPAGCFDALECAPDNWIGVGGRFGEALADLSHRYPLFAHGLSLSLGGADPFDPNYLRAIRDFLDHHRVPLFSEHLSYCAHEGQLYDLLPLPFTDEAVHHVAARIRQVQDALGRRIAIENVSYYAAPFRKMDELDFIRAVLQEADCALLLDVNNVFVNQINHGDDGEAFIRGLPAGRVVAFHVAGHFDEADDLKIDTHGAAVKPAVWDLLALAYRVHGVQPTFLERDFNFPPLELLLQEVTQIRDVQSAVLGQVSVDAHA